MLRDACLFCGGDPSEPDHFAHCDGRQGRIESTEHARARFDLPPLDAEDMPPLISGIVPETYAASASAAASVEETRDTLRARVLADIALAGHHGRTDDELQIDLGLDGNTERPRRWELWKLDRIAILRDGEGRAVKRLTRTRRQAVVWVAREIAS